MEENYSKDIGEEIISKLKELNIILEKIVKERNVKEFPHTHSSRN